MHIRRYEPSDEEALFALCEKDEGFGVYAKNLKAVYQTCLQETLTYVLVIDSRIEGYVRAVKDGALYLYVVDLLVNKPYRGKHYGKALLTHIKKTHQSYAVYVMSDEDGYYESIAYPKVGSIFEVKE